MYALGCLLFWLLAGRTPVRRRRPPRRRPPSCPRGRAVARVACAGRSGRSRSGRRRAPRLRPARRDRLPTRCSSASAPRRRRSRARLPRRLESAERATAVFSEPPRSRRCSSRRGTTGAPEAPSEPADGPRRGRDRRRGWPRVRRSHDRECRPGRRGAARHRHDREAGAGSKWPTRPTSTPRKRPCRRRRAAPTPSRSRPVA